MPLNHCSAHIIQHSNTEITELLAPDKFQLVSETGTWLNFEADQKKSDGSIVRKVFHAGLEKVVDGPHAGQSVSTTCPFEMRRINAYLEFRSDDHGVEWHQLELEDGMKTHLVTDFDPTAVFAVGQAPAVLSGYLVFAVTSEAAGAPSARRLWQVDLQEIVRIRQRSQEYRRSNAKAQTNLPSAGTDQVAGETEA